MRNWAVGNSAAEKHLEGKQNHDIQRMVCAQHQHCLGGVRNAEHVAHLGSTESESAFNHIPR